MQVKEVEEILEEKLITYNTAKVAREKNFNIYQKSQYSRGSNPETVYNYTKEQCRLFNDVYYAPTQSLLQQWLRVKFNIHIQITLVDTLCNIYCYHISTTNNGCRPDSKFYHSYEEALEYGLLESLQMID